MALHGSAATSTAAQFSVAGIAALALPALPLWLAIVFGAVPTIYYTLLTVDYVRNWKPPSVQRQTVGAVLAKITDLVGVDRPYLVAFAIAGIAIVSSLGYHIPDWVYGLLGAGGLISVHRLASAAVVLDKPVIAPTVVVQPTAEGTKT